MTEKKKSGPFGGLSAQEAAERSAKVRKAKAEEREQEATENALTFRQRLGVSLSKLSQKELDSVVKTLAQSNTPGSKRHRLAGLAPSRRERAPLERRRLRGRRRDAFGCSGPARELAARILGA